MLKKLISLFLIALTLLSFVSCTGEYQFGVVNTDSSTDSSTDLSTDTDTNTDTGSSDYVPPTMNDDPTDDFVVTIKADGQPYTPRMEMFVYWNDGFSIHKARVDEKGVARIDGLDGDYNVTLSAVPNEYTYNPNDNLATNDNRSIELNLYTLNLLSGSGTGIYDCYNFKKTGVYRATINSPEEAIFFQYAPDGMGTYSIESWVDITADNINPCVDVYYGSSQWKQFEKTINDGGPIGSYTINFIHEVSIAKENISGGGQATYTFALRAEEKNGKYPIAVTFAVKRNGDFELPKAENIMTSSNGMIVPTYDFTGFNREDHEYGDEYELVTPEIFYSGRTYVFDEKRFKLWEKNDGGDDFYHLYDEELYASTNGYGPILYAHIKSATRFVDKPFTAVEYNDKGEIVYNNLGSYKHLIEGISNTARPGHYYCSSLCTCHSASDTIWACPSNCSSCHDECTPCKPELMSFEGYQHYANTDGLVPVTKDIKNFLFAYCEKQEFFKDGIGTLENKLVAGKYFQAVGDSGWLFGCSYYVEK